jgi:hypothetical protein
MTGWLLREVWLFHAYMFDSGLRTPPVLKCGEERCTEVKVKLLGNGIKFLVCFVYLEKVGLH